MSVRALVFARWRRDGGCETRRLDAQAALALLIEDRLWLGDPITPAQVKRFLAWLEGIPAFRLDYTTLDEAEAAIAELFSER